jgi:hypothetical protein
MKVAIIEPLCDGHPTVGGFLFTVRVMILLDTLNTKHCWFELERCLLKKYSLYRSHIVTLTS